ncbi:hypothetical protein BG011_005480 [Mortierella polycephala]|uniref:Crinkler effector protein N-terminal domain-containing protein n=1 Tax=Mortierella polycephala TaxID=41804 RepID=A0A9P6QBS4_9FUNG|nr:hypothetical protein BG011_005480 [Mortierella polycephala]
MSNSLALSCVINGEAASNAFKVKLDRNSDVGDLKDKVVAKAWKVFGDIDAKNLATWQVMIPTDEDASKERIIAAGHDTKRRLKATV